MSSVDRGSRSGVEVGPPTPLKRYTVHTSGGLPTQKVVHNFVGKFILAQDLQKLASPTAYTGKTHKNKTKTSEFMSKGKFLRRIVDSHRKGVACK